MTTVQLRRYDIAPGEMDLFVGWWRESIVGAREAYGFRVLFAFADDVNNEFVWAVAHDGDYAAADAAWNASSERAAALAIAPSPARGHHLSNPKVVVGPWTMS